MEFQGDVGDGDDDDDDESSSMMMMTMVKMTNLHNNHHQCHHPDHHNDNLSNRCGWPMMTERWRVNLKTGEN